MIDSHCHLADTKFAADLPEVLTRANEAGVTHQVCIADTIDEADTCQALAEQYDQIFYTSGVHPHAAKTWEEVYGDRIRQHATHSKLVAVGEIGLDYHYMHSPKETQIEVFRTQIAVAQELNLPIVVHNRDSFEDLLPIIDELKPRSMVLHCCTEPWENAKQVLDRGYLLGFTGMATYPKLEHIREVITQCPIEQLMIETDAPYLAPQSVRGKRCEPAFVKEVAELVAELKDLPLAEVDAITTKTTKEFYALP